MNNSALKLLADVHPPWRQSPHKPVRSPLRLMSLRDMIEFLGYEFISLLSQLENEGKNAWQQVQKHGDACATTEADRVRLGEMLVRMSIQCQRLGLANSNNKIKHVMVRINNPLHTPLDPKSKFAVVESELSGLHHALMCDLCKQKFAFITELKAQYFEREDLFGGEFRDSASSEINAEIKAAGNCLAVDLNTAAVFHLMRAVEYAMRGMVRHLKIKVKNKPLEHAGWDELIKLIEKRARETREKYDKSKNKKKGDLELSKFYRLMADEMNIFKEIWRNSVMHTQGTYTATEALAVFERVRGFMQRLIKQVSLL